MLLFTFAVVVALVGVGAYDLYNPGTQAVTMAGYHLAAVPDWAPIAAAAAVPLSLFLLHALWTSARILLLKRAARRTLDGDWELFDAPLPPAPSRAAVAARPVVGPQPAPKRSWLPPD